MNALRSVSGAIPVLHRELAGLHLFQGVNFSTVASLLKACPVRTVSAGQAVLTPDTGAGEAMYLVLSGQLRVHLHSPASEPVATIGTGESFGEVSLIDRLAPSGYVVTVSECRLLVVEQDIFWALVQSAPGLARNLLVTLAARLRRDHHPLDATRRQQLEFRQDDRLDSDTGAHSEKWLRTALARQIQRQNRNGRPLTLLLLEITDLPGFAAEYGSVAAQAALRAVAEAIAGCVRPADLVARWGSEGFAIVLTDTASHDALPVARRIQVACEQVVVSDGNESFLQSISVKTCLAALEPDQTMEALLASARVHVLHR